MYVHDNNDSLPPNISRYLGSQQSQPGFWVLGNAQLDATTTNIQNGVLLQYYQVPRAFTIAQDSIRVAKNPGFRAAPGSDSFGFYMTTPACASDGRP